MTAGQLADWLAQLPFEAVRREALEQSAATLADEVREALSQPPLAGGHEAPWLRSGALRDSIGHAADDVAAVVGSSSPVAVFQEMGTAHDSPRPFLSPVGVRSGEAAARFIGSAIAEMFR